MRFADAVKNTVLNAFQASRMGQPVADVAAQSASLTRVLMRDATDEDNARLKGIASRWDAYYGNGKKPLNVKTGDTDDNIRLNFAGRVVDAGVSMLFGEDLDWVVEDGRDDAEDDVSDVDADDAGDGDDDAPAPNPADDWLEACWDANLGMTLLTDLGINGGVTGDAYAMILPPAEGDAGHPYPQILAVDPATVSATWDPCNVRRVLQWVLRWTAMDPASGRPVQYRKLISRADDQTWIIADQTSRNDGRFWEPAGDPVVWPFPWAPLFHAKNLPAPNQFYGTSDLEDDVLEAGDAVNFTTSNTGRILRLHAHPKTWGRGIEANQIKMGIDSLLIVRGENAHLENLEMTSDLSSSLTFKEQLTRDFHAIARIPEIATGQLQNLGQLSGLALKVLYGPLLKKNKTKQRLYGDMLRDLSQRLLEMGGFPGQKVTITWPDPLPSDPAAERSAAATDEQLGVSKETILSKLGYDAKAEMKRKSLEQADLGDHLLGQFDRGQTGGSGAVGNGGQTGGDDGS